MVFYGVCGEVVVYLNFLLASVVAENICDIFVLE